MRTLFFLLILFSFVSVNAQQDLPDFGQFDEDQINYKECPVDPEADAVVFFDNAKGNFDDNHYLETQHRVRFKILKQKGIERGDIHITYYSGDNFESVRDVDAVILTYDDNHNKALYHLDKKAIFTKKINPYYSEVVFTLPNVKVGSIIDYKYSVSQQGYWLKEWTFQKEIPVLKSSYEIYILPNYEFTYRVQKNPNLKVDITSDKNLGKTTFTMENIPGLRDEAYMASENDYLQKVIFQLSGFTNYFGKNKRSTTWEEMSRELLEDRMFGIQLNKDVSDGGVIKEILARTSSPFEKMSLIHDYVRSHFTWNHATTIYADNGVKKVWEEKKGDAGELNLLLINLLKSAGLETYPILISERNHGKVDAGYPFKEQFNKVAAYVLIDKKAYFLDATDHETPSSLIPYSFLNTKGYIVDKKKGGFITITDDQHKMRVAININATLDNKANLEGTASIFSFDYERLAKEKKYANDKDKYWHAYLAAYQGLQIDSFKMENIGTDTLPIVENFNLTTHLSKSGDYYLLNYNLFTGYYKNEFISKNRFSNIDFGCPQTCDFNGHFNLPENVTIESIPKSITLRMPDNSMVFMRSVDKSDNMVNIGFRIQILRTEFTPDEYELVQSFYKKLYDMINEPVVLKAK